MEIKNRNYTQLLFTAVGLVLLFAVLVMNHYRPYNYGVGSITPSYSVNEGG